MSVAFNSAAVAIGSVCNLSSDTLGCVLTNVLPDAINDSVLTDITQIANGNGYVTDGPDLTIISWGDTDILGIAELVNQQPTFLASGGSIGPFRYAVLYDKTPATPPLLSFYDYGAIKTLAAGESVIVPFDDGTNFGTLRIGVGTIA